MRLSEGSLLTCLSYQDCSVRRHKEATRVHGGVFPLQNMNISYETFEQQFCSAELVEGLHKELICLLVVNIFLSITAFLGNTLILVALHKESSLHPPSKLLFHVLAITDLCVGIIVEPLAVTYWISLVNERLSMCRGALAAGVATGQMLIGVSLLTLSAISVDRLLALLLGLRYRQVVTLKRTYVTVIVFWIVCIVDSTMYFWNFVLMFWCDKIFIPLCLVASVYCYTKIFLGLRHHHNQVRDNVQEQQSQAIPMNIARYKKAVSSALWLQLTLVVCYLPYIILLAYTMARNNLSSSLFIASQFSVTLVYLNSSLNPILYCWKIREVRQAVKDTIRQLFPCSSS